MEKQTKILIGASALALAYYLYNQSKAAKAKSPIGATPITPVTTIPSPSPIVSAVTPINPITPIPPFVPSPIGDMSGSGTNDIAGLEAARIAAAEKQYRDEEAARNKANQLAYEAYLAEVAAQAAADKAAENKLIADRQKAIDEAATAEAARQKAINDMMYNCPEGFEWYQYTYRCMPTSVIVEEKANRGEGLILRDFQNNTTKLVQSCPAEYVKQGINCIPRYSLSPQQLQVMAMQDAGMVQTSDGQWYLDAKSAAAAQAIIDSQITQYSSRAYSARQSSINDNICSIDRDGYVNNPYSSTNGMSLSQYIGQFKVTAGELGIARNSCPNSIYSSNLIVGGRADDETLGYKDYSVSNVVYDKKTAVEPNTKPCETTIYNCYGPSRKETIQIPIYDDCFNYQNAKPPCAPPPEEWVYRGDSNF
jgi:hypothetical protein